MNNWKIIIRLKTIMKKLTPIYEMWMIDERKMAN
jgi:hypothetical protein